MADGVIQLVTSGQRLILDAAGDGRAVSWNIDGHEVLGRKSSALIDYGMYAMGPWAGRINNNLVTVDGHTFSMPITHDRWALHGTTLGRSCRVVEIDQDADEARAVTETDLGRTWPWKGVLRSTWHLHRGGLDTELEVIAKDETFPSVVGWHPWFQRTIAGVDAIWTLSEPKLAERRDDYSFTGQLVDLTAPHGTFDDAFRSNGSACIAWPGVMRIDIVNSHPWFVVFDREPTLLCIEPQTGPPNGINDGLGDPIAWTQLDDPIRMRTTWAITREA